MLIQRVNLSALLKPLSAAAFALLAFAPSQICTAQAVPRIQGPIDDGALVVLSRNTHPLASTLHDQGPVDDALSGRMLLVLRRSQEQQESLERLVRDQQSPGSANYHKWITPATFGKQYGVADADIETITSYLADHGFSVGRVYPSQMAIEVSGTAAQIRETFHTEIHSYLIDGEKYYANATDPRIPAALEPVVSGFASLGNIRTQQRSHAPLKSIPAAFDLKNHQIHPEYTGPNAAGQTVYVLAPADIQTIYNIPTQAANAATARLQANTVGVVGDSQIDLNNVSTYQLITGGGQTPVEIVDGSDPAILGTTQDADAEIAYEQLELISAAAPKENLNYYVSATTDYDTGLDFAIIRAVTDNAVSVLAIGFQACESNLGAANNSFINQAWLQAAAQGITVVAASGDTGPAGCDTPGSALSTGGLAVNGYASTPYDTAVGGTDFYYAGGNGSAYWSTANGTTFGSATAYIPEQAWNDSYLATDSNPSAGTTTAQNSILYAGGGGLSTLGSVLVDGVTPGPYASPSWQTGFTTGTARAVPDVSFFAGNDYNSAQYGLCVTSNDCTTLISASSVSLLGGTAGAAAVFAGVMAQVVQKYGLQGNANPTLYALYTLLTPNSLSVYHSANTGSNKVKCSGGTGCPTGGGYLQNPAGTANYNQSTGLGSINVGNLLSKWGTYEATAASTTSLSITTAAGVSVTASVVHGSPLNFSAKVTGAGLTPTGNVSFTTGLADPSENGIIATPLSAGTASSASDYFLPGGTYSVTARYGGSSTYLPSTSTYPIVITPEPSQTTIYSSKYLAGASLVFGTPITITAEAFSLNNNNVTSPTGTISVYNSVAVNHYAMNVLPVNAEGAATFASNVLTGGTYSIQFGYSGDQSFQPSLSTTPYALTITQAPTVTTLSATGTTAISNASVTLTATVMPASSLAVASGIQPTGYVKFNTVPLQTPTLITGLNAAGQPVSTASIQVLKSQVNGALTATYCGTSSSSCTGDTNYSNSASASSVTVTAGTKSYNTNSSLLLGFNGINPIPLNATFTITGTATVAGTATQGTVIFYANGVLLNSTPAATDSTGKATYSMSPPAGGYLPFTTNQIEFTGVFTPTDTTVAPSSANQIIGVIDDRDVADFSLSTDLTSQIITPSSNVALFQIQLASIANFAGSNARITLACTIPGSSNLVCAIGNTAVATTSTTSYQTNIPLSGTESLMLQISGTPATVTASAKPALPAGRWWLVEGGSILACVFLLSIPARRKEWRSIIAATVCFFILSGSLLGCGSNSQFAASAASGGLNGSGSATAGANFTNGIATNQVPNGTYTVVITGTATTNTTLIHNTSVQITVSGSPILPNGGIYTLANLNNVSSHLLMTDTGPSSTAGQDNLLFYTGSSPVTNSQKWVFNYQGNGYYTIENKASSLYVTDPNSGVGFVVATLQPLITPADGTQLWTLEPLEGGFEIVNASSGAVLTNDQWGNTSGVTNIINYAQKGSTQAIDQTWFIQPLS